MRKVLFVLVALGLSLPLLAQDVGTSMSTPTPSWLAVGADTALDASVTPKPKEIVAKFLDLSADQIAQWDVLLQNQLDALKPLAEQLKANNEALRTLLEQPAPDPATAGTLVIKGKQLGEQMGAAHKQYLQGFEALLTSEQKGRLGAVRMAHRLQPVLPAFTLLGLLPRN